MKQWKFDGNEVDFIELVQWAMVLRQLTKDGVKEAFWIVMSPSKVERYSRKYGMSFGAISDEMMRIAKEIDKGLRDVY